MPSASTSSRRKSFRFGRGHALAFVVVVPLLPVAVALADTKQIHSATCQPHTNNTLDPAFLRYQQDGIVNLHAASKYVICPLPRDAEAGWTSPQGTAWTVAVHFSMPNGWIPRLTSNQCTLSVESGDPLANEVQQPSVTRSAVQDVSGPPLPLRATVLFSEADFAPDAYFDGDGKAVLVCRIAPNNTLTHIVLAEDGPTDSSGG